MVPVPLTVEPVMKNASNICLIQIVRLKAYITNHTLAAFICCKNWTNYFFGGCFLRESDPCVSLGSICSRRGKENQLMSEVRTVERIMIPHRDVTHLSLHQWWANTEVPFKQMIIFIKMKALVISSKIIELITAGMRSGKGSCLRSLSLFRRNSQSHLPLIRLVHSSRMTHKNSI